MALYKVTYQKESRTLQSLQGPGELYTTRVTEEAVYVEADSIIRVPIAISNFAKPSQIVKIEKYSDQLYKA